MNEGAALQSAVQVVPLCWVSVVFSSAASESTKVNAAQGYKGEMSLLADDRGMFSCLGSG